MNGAPADLDTDVGERPAQEVADVGGAGTVGERERQAAARSHAASSRRGHRAGIRRVPLPDLERVGAVFVLRQDPAETIALIVFEQDDLVALDDDRLRA